MSTNANLPAGFSITSIDGVRCTAVPRSLTTLSSAGAAAASSTISEAVQQTTAASVQIQTSSAAIVQSTTSIASSSVAVVAPPSSTAIVAAPPTSSSLSSSIVSVASTPPLTTTSAAAAATSTTIPFINTSTSEAQTSTISSSASTASKGTTPTTSSSTPVAIAQSEIHISTTSTPSISVQTGGNGNFNSLAMSISSTTEPTAALSTAESSADGGVSSNPPLTAAPVVGGVLGSIGLIAGFAFLFWFLRRRRKVGRESLLTPLTTGRQSQFYGSDTNSVRAGPSYDEKWNPDRGNRVQAVASSIKSGLVGIGSSLKSKVVRDRSDTPSVDLNRGNSQFIDGPIPQHSRNNSVLSNTGGNLTVKDRFQEWFGRIKDDISFKLRMRKLNEDADPFAAARGMTEKQAKLNNPPDFSQLLGMDDRELQLQAERRRADLGKTQSGASLPPLGSLGLNFASNDPFADPVNGANSNQRRRSQSAYDATSNPFADPTPQASNPFVDPISQPQPSIAKQNTYIADIRRSRGQSIDATNTGPSGAYRPPSTMTGPVSRYPSSLAPSRDSFRDTVFSSFSANARKGKGRSDPFDLERPELWRRNPNNNYSNRQSGRQRGASISGVRDSESQMYPNPLTTANLQGQQSTYGARAVSGATQARQSNGTYESKYSSGVSSLGGWGDPGPDLGPGSISSSLRGNASSNGGSGDFSANGGAGTGNGGMEIYDSKGFYDPRSAVEKRGDGNVSPVSMGSSKNGVGKAM